MQFKLIAVLFLVISLLTMTGCTPEKAEALLTVIRAFEAQSNEALNAYEDLFKEYGALKKESQEELFTQAYEANQAGQSSLSFSDAVANVGDLQTDKINNKIENDFAQLKAAYALLSSAYASLPQGNLTGAKYVSCGQTAVSKLTKQLVNFSSDINKNPLYPAALRLEYEEFKALAKQGAEQKEKTQQKFNNFYSGVAAYEKKHKDAIIKTLAAVEQGNKLQKLLNQYDSVTVSSVLGVIQYGFAYASALNGINLTEALEKLNMVKSELEKDPNWVRVESIPLTAIAECNI